MKDSIKRLNTEIQRMANEAKTLYAEMLSKSADGTKAYEGHADDLAKFNNLVDAGQLKREELKRLEKLDAIDGEVNHAAPDEAKELAPAGRTEIKSFGRQFAESDELKAALAIGGAQPIVRVEMKDIFEGVNPNTAAVAAGAGGVLVMPDHRPAIYMAPQRPLSILDVLPVVPVSSNAVDYIVEDIFTNASAFTAEKGTKPESNATFRKEVALIKTIAHWLAVTRQMLEDAPRIRAYIDIRLTSKLKEKLEDQIIDGPGTGETLLGLLRTVGLIKRTHGTALNGLGGGGDNKLDTFRHAITDLTLRFFKPDVIILHPVTADELETLKDSQGRYLERYDPVTRRLWRLRTVETPAMDSAVGGDLQVALLLDSSMSAEVYDRQIYAIYTGQPNAMFLTNQFAILAEGRFGLAVPYPAGMEEIIGL